MTRSLPTPAELPRNAQRQLERLPPDLRDLAAACYPTEATEAAARLELEREQRRAIRAEQESLRALADGAEAGTYGPEGKELARQLLAGGRTHFNLSALRAALKRLR